MKIYRIIWMSAAVFFLAGSWVWSQSKNVTFLPRDEEMVSQRIAYDNYTLLEKECATDEFVNAFARCNECQKMRLECSDCCLKKMPITNKSIAMRCTVTDDIKYANRAPSFVPDDQCAVVRDCAVAWNVSHPFDTIVERDQYCSDHAQTAFGSNFYEDNLPYCQVQGCAGVDSEGAVNAQPKAKVLDDKCEMVGADKAQWVCNTADLDQPLFKGCQAFVGNYYTITAALECPVSMTNPSGDPCYNYEFSSAYLIELNACRNTAMAYEQYIKDSQCCQMSSQYCCGSHNAAGECVQGVALDAQHNPISEPGCAMNCTSSSCQERIVWEECQPSKGGVTNPLCCDNPDLDQSQCIEYASKMTECMDPKNGSCLDCFLPFGTVQKPFQYEFVAKSGQKSIIIWQLHVKPQYLQAETNGGVKTAIAGALPNTGPLPLAYLYTRIKIFDVTGGGEKEVFPLTSGKGVINQRAFSGAFSIYAANTVGVGADGKDIFKQGRKYRVKLLWYIPKLYNYFLSAEVQRGEFTIIKIRE